MITREADYAIRILLHLAKNAANPNPVSSADLAKEMMVPYRFMRRIGLKLHKSGFVESKKGKGGGLFLLKSPSSVSILDILRVFDEHGMTLNVCLVKNQEGNKCPRNGFCSVHKEISALQNILEARLGSLTLDKLA